MWGVEKVMRVRSCVCIFGMGMAMSKALASDPEGNAKLFPSGSCADVDSVYAENVHQSHQMLLPNDCSPM